MNFNKLSSVAKWGHLVVLGVAAAGEEIDEQHHQGEDEPRRRHRPDDAQRLQVQLRVGPEPLVLQPVEGDVHMRNLGPANIFVIMLQIFLRLILPTWCSSTAQSVGWYSVWRLLVTCVSYMAPCHVSRGAGHAVTLPHSPSYHFSVSPYCFCVLLGFRDLGSPSLSHFVSIFWKQREVDHDGGDIGHEYK